MRRLALIAISLAGCGHAPNDLWGSLGESFPLEFDRVDILKQDAALRIEYIKDVPGGEEWVCKVVVDTTNLTIGNNSEIQDELFLERVTVERVATTGGDFPELAGGSIKFEEYDFEIGGRIDGEVTALFENGRNLFGNFDGHVKEVSTQ
ncbi:MAG: hypothetical protein HYZ27_06435 [Deltaproteobacteria bacterium]|nr:hypothetical protein [Deltaproteobacteria bacterium]